VAKGRRLELGRAGEREVISQIPIHICRSALGAIMLSAVILFATPPAVRAQQVVALVDGEPITALDIEQRAKFVQLSTNKAPTRQEVLDGLIDEILEIREAKKFSIDVPDSEVENSYSEVAKRMNIDTQKLTEMLAKDGTSGDTLKHRLRAELAWNALVRGRFKASLEIADSDVEAELQLHKTDEKNDVGYEYILRPILLVVPPGSGDAAYDARKREADALRGRFQDCTAGIPFARALTEVAVRDQVVKFSADLPSALRDILDKMDVGHLTPPEQTSEGIQMFALCSKKETTSDTPEKKEIRDQIFQKKFGAKAKRYLADLRREAMIEYK
jgi:peptidyl-prolyl cis-trans isomerase SurA